MLDSSDICDFNLDNQEWMDNVTAGDYLKYYEDMYSHR